MDRPETCSARTKRPSVGSQSDNRKGRIRLSRMLPAGQADVRNGSKADLTASKSDGHRTMSVWCQYRKFAALVSQRMRAKGASERTIEEEVDSLNQCGDISGYEESYPRQRRSTTEALARVHSSGQFSETWRSRANVKVNTTF